MNAYRSASFYVRKKCGHKKSSSDKSEELLNIFSLKFSKRLSDLSSSAYAELELTPFFDCSKQVVKASQGQSLCLS